jgi:tRNA-dihydrouridine synthase B
MSVKIGNIQLETNVLLAPMSGVTDLPYRKIVKEFGAGLVISEMIASRAMILETRQSMQKCAILQDDASAASVQLAGCDPTVMAEAAKMNEDLGAKIIDINFGCPVKKVVGGNAGSALMKDVPLATKILEATVKAVKIPVTLKMRMGWNHQSLNAPELAKIAEDLGIQMITVHGRTRCQLYDGIADWKFIRNVKNVVKMPVIANGDILNWHDAKAALEESGADGVMIGRGAYGKPWLINQISHYLQTGEELEDPSFSTKRDTIIRHYQDILDHYGEEIGLRLAKKHLGWYSSGMNDSADFRRKINLCVDPKLAFDYIKEFFIEERPIYE